MKKNNKLCKTCKSEIHYDAKKCVECDTYQTWRRHLQFGNNFLALLIAFISVLTIGLPIISNSLKSPNTNFSFTPVNGVYRNISQNEALKLRGEEGVVLSDTIQNSGGFFLQIITTNSGKKSGVITKVEVLGLKIERAESTDRWLEFIIIGEKFSGSLLIEPDETKIVTTFFHQDRRGAHQLNLNNSLKKLKVKITFVDNNGLENVLLLKHEVEWHMDLPVVF